MVKLRSDVVSEKKWARKLREEKDATGKKAKVAGGQPNQSSVDNFIDTYSVYNKPHRKHIRMCELLHQNKLLSKNKVAFKRNGQVINPVKLDLSNFLKAQQSC